MEDPGYLVETLQLLDPLPEGPVGFVPHRRAVASISPGYAGRQGPRLAALW
jgi:hypothetical protein